MTATFRVRPLQDVLRLQTQFDIRILTRPDHQKVKQDITQSVTGADDPLLLWRRIVSTGNAGAGSGCGSTSSLEQAESSTDVAMDDIQKKRSRLG